MNTESSPYSKPLQEIKRILKETEGISLSPEKRKERSIELASHLLEQAEKELTYQDRKELKKIADMIANPVGKAFMISVTDQCFRTHSDFRVSIQMNEILGKFGVPEFLPFWERFQLIIFRLLPVSISQFFIPLLNRALRKQTKNVILPAELPQLKQHLQKRKEERIRLNINHLGEAILGEKEAKKRLQIYLDDLQEPLIDYVSIKISTIFSQINLLAYDDTIEEIAKKLRALYHAAIENPIKNEEGESVPKFVNLDMEEHKDLHLTIDVFKKVLEEPEFLKLPAGLVLQAYIPESFTLLQKLTEWAIKRKEKGGSYIKIRIVKGANLANEQVDASIHGWEQCPYTSKLKVDANYKKMVLYALQPQNIEAVHIGIASHNLFDISFALILCTENKIFPCVDFEMLEGMSPHIQKAVQKVTGSILLYCPVSLRHDFQYAIAYLVRRLDENTGAENFLRQIFNLKPHSHVFEEQAEFFAKSCDIIETISNDPRRSQNRLIQKVSEHETLFENEPDTDFSSLTNLDWSQKTLEEWKKKTFDPVPLVIQGKDLLPNTNGKGIDPSQPNQTLYQYALAEKNHIEDTITSAQNYFSTWSKTSLDDRCALLQKIADTLRNHRKDFFGVMLLDTGKIFAESDPEISEAIDNAEYYSRRIRKLFAFDDMDGSPKGVVLVTPPWNFSCAIPLGGIVGALVTGNTVIFKPAPESVLVGWHLVNLLWEAGVPKEALQFLNCRDEPEGEQLIQDPRISLVVLTGATETAKKFLSLRPTMDLTAETGGKNGMIVTALSDRDLAIQCVIHSAFSYAGQKCSACSLLVLEQEVYDDQHFFKQLKDATESLFVGSSHNLQTKVNPLIQAPNETLLKGLTELEEGEEWLLEPKCLGPDNLWSPGIKIGVQPGSFSHQNEFFGPILSVMRAKDLDHAIQIVNGTPYGLTSGLQSLDESEQDIWIDKIEAGNCYINRTITGAIIRRQPFGGCKNSSFGNAFKAGGPNYLYNFLTYRQKNLPQHKSPVNHSVNNLALLLDKISLTAEELGLWYASIANYSFWQKKMRINRDPTKLVGQDNLFRYVPRKDLSLRITPQSSPMDILRIIAATLSCDCHMYISLAPDVQLPYNLQEGHLSLKIRTENEQEFFQAVKTHHIRRIRIIGEQSDSFIQSAAEHGCHIANQQVLANGRFELLHYLRELSISIDYHRYGNLGLRENELRKQIL